MAYAAWTAAVAGRVRRMVAGGSSTSARNVARNKAASSAGCATRIACEGPRESVAMGCSGLGGAAKAAAALGMVTGSMSGMTGGGGRGTHPRRLNGESGGVFRFHQLTIS
jgi:hypothetical protein